MLIAKFIPGLAIIAPPLASAKRIGWPRFIALTISSSVLWVGFTELYYIMQTGAKPIIVNVRSPTAHDLDPRGIPGARLLHGGLDAWVAPGYAAGIVEAEPRKTQGGVR